MISAPALPTALSHLLEGLPGGGKVGVMGSPRVAAKLAEEGHHVVAFTTSSTKAKSLDNKGGKVSEGELSGISCEVDAIPVPPKSFKAFFAVGVFGSHRVSHVGAVTRVWSSKVCAGGVLAVAELAGESWLGRLMMRMARRLRGRPTKLDPTDLCSLVLGAGLKEVHQVWPQGLGAWVLTYGRRGVLDGGNAVGQDGVSKDGVSPEDVVWTNSGK